MYLSGLPSFGHKWLMLIFALQRNRTEQLTKMCLVGYSQLCVETSIESLKSDLIAVCLRYASDISVYRSMYAPGTHWHILPDCAQDIGSPFAAQLSKSTSRNKKLSLFRSEFISHLCSGRIPMAIANKVAQLHLVRQLPSVSVSLIIV
jgi:hypothetical protein